MKRFLVIQLRAIGDVVLTTPLPHIIKEADPEAFVGFITQGPSDQLLLNNPNVDKVFVYKPKEGLSGQLRLMREVRKYGFEVALDTNGTPGTELFALFSGAKTRAGFRSGRRSFTYTHRIARGGGYVVEVKKSLLRAIGIKSFWDRPEIFPTEDEAGWAKSVRDDILAKRGAKILFTVDATHKHPYRRWPVERYADLCRMIADRLGAVGVALWGPGEIEGALKLAELSGGAVVPSPQTSLRTLAAFIEAADFHIGNCSAPRHIAVAVNTPTFIIPGTSQDSWSHPSPLHATDPFRPTGEAASLTREDGVLRAMADRSAKEVAPCFFEFLERILELKKGG